MQVPDTFANLTSSSNACIMSCHAGAARRVLSCAVRLSEDVCGARLAQGAMSPQMPLDLHKQRTLPVTKQLRLQLIQVSP